MPKPVSVGLLLSRMSAEIAAVADSIGSIQVGGTGATHSGSTLTDGDLIDLQKLDRAEQTLRSLAALLGEIARSDAGAACADLGASIDRLPLAALAGRLGGIPQVEPSAGVIELF